MSGPKIVLCSMPKAGSGFLTRYLIAGLGIDHHAPPRPRGAWPKYTLDEEQLEDLWRRSAFVWQVHLSVDHLPALADYVDRVVLHTRDPRQAALSWTHHAPNSSGSSTRLGARNFDPPPDLYSRPFARQLEWTLENHLPATCEWAARWFRAADELAQVPSPTIRVNLTSYDELHADKTALARRICAFYGREFDESTARAVPLGATYRLGEREEWRRVFSPEQARWCQAELDRWGLGDRWSRYD